MPLVLNSSGSYEFTDWEEDVVGTLLLGATVGLLLARITGVFKITQKGQEIIGALSGAATAKGFSLEKRGKLYISNKKLWYGKVYHNVFTGEVVHVEQQRIEESKAHEPFYSYLQEKIIYTLTNDVVATKTTPMAGIYAGNPEDKDVSNPIPKVGQNIYW